MDTHKGKVKLIIANQPTHNGVIYTEESLKAVAKKHPSLIYEHGALWTYLIHNIKGENNGNY